jgi:hypothetical protein
MQNFNTSCTVFVNRVYLSKVMSCWKNADIGAVFGVAIQAVTNAAREVEKRKEADRRFNLELMGIKKIIEEAMQSV